MSLQPLDRDIRALVVKGESAETQEGWLGGKTTNPILVDSHVHFYGGYDVTLFFDSALSNFRQGSQDLRLRHEPLVCLWFTEGLKHNYFHQFAQQGNEPPRGPWGFHHTEESCSLYAIRENGEEILIISGRQIQTKEGLEVLAVGSTQHVAERMTLDETLARVKEIGSIAIIPWGFGKWWFRRGAVLTRLVESSQPGSFFLGDNSGRPLLSKRPRHFHAAEERGFAVLPGSDPLPFPYETTKVGRYGFLMDGQVCRKRPAEQLKRMAQEIVSTPPAFGGLEGFLAFCRNQSIIHINKHVKRVKP
jgi:hypothetical protein